MSVMLLDLSVYKAVFNKACGYRYRKTVDINYCYTLSLGEGRIREWVEQLYEMNEVSHAVRYRKEVDWEGLDIPLSIIRDWRYNNTKGPGCNAYQMLKHLQCIHYQIEMDEIRRAGLMKDCYEEAYRMLEKAIGEMQSHIIHAIPEYKEAKWGSV